MASAMYPDDTNAPPPYSAYNGTKTGVPYQQIPPPVHSPNFSSSSPPLIPAYTQTTAVHPVIATPFLSHSPVLIQCPACHQQVITVVQYEAGDGTWLISLLICLFGGFLGCCLIPFCIPSCQDAVHTCPSCRNLIGRRNVF